MLTRMRIWLPDAPGILAAVAAEIGMVDGNVIGLEVLERQAGVAIDELVVELPDDPNAVEAVCKGIRNVPGAGVEEVHELASMGADREDTVLNAAAAILQAATPPAAMNAMIGRLLALFGLSWLALADPDCTQFIEVHGEAPSVEWVAAFAEGARSGVDQANDTTNTGIFIEAMPETEFTVCGGRTAAIRRRERHEIATLIMVTARFVDALGRREHSHS
ncbi:MAG TPA: hypothetical protein VHU85_07095 [Acidimicrobiales bacterium]|nr:hypothetical protein [Acidimicrobiales bacterium]